jgi:hypothetical protein
MCDYKLGKRILRYLAGTSDYRLDVLSDSAEATMQFEVYTDADWASEHTDRNSVNAALMFLNGMLVSCHCNKQTLVSLSTMESELVSAARGVQEAMGCYHLVKELGLKIQLPMRLRMDNQAAVACIMNEASIAKTKQVEIKHTFIKDLDQQPCYACLRHYPSNESGHPNQDHAWSDFCTSTNYDWCQSTKIP